ncbi:MAG TPA: hypothetical protein VHE37_13445 [Nevskiaceae bacterium]|nr:hypothetical protein [Nevskiaceae bacterium]
MNTKIEKLESALRTRIAGLKDWLDQNGRGCREKQAHLTEDSDERAYWHYGYWVALVDLLALLTAEDSSG